jgi:hypothetical protein
MKFNSNSMTPPNEEAQAFKFPDSDQIKNEPNGGEIIVEVSLFHQQ